MVERPDAGPVGHVLHADLVVADLLEEVEHRAEDDVAALGDSRRPRSGGRSWRPRTSPCRSRVSRRRQISGRFLIGNVDFRFESLPWWSDPDDHRTSPPSQPTGCTRVDAPGAVRRRSDGARPGNGRTAHDRRRCERARPDRPALPEPTAAIRRPRASAPSCSSPCASPSCWWSPASRCSPSACPTVSEALGLSQATQTWVVDAYALTLASLLLVAGALGDRFGRAGRAARRHRHLRRRLAALGVRRLRRRSSSPSGPSPASAAR